LWGPLATGTVHDRTVPDVPRSRCLTLASRPRVRPFRRSTRCRCRGSRISLAFGFVVGVVHPPGTRVIPVIAIVLVAGRVWVPIVDRDWRSVARPSRARDPPVLVGCRAAGLRAIRRVVGRPSRTLQEACPRTPSPTFRNRRGVRGDQGRRGFPGPPSAGLLLLPRSSILAGPVGIVSGGRGTRAANLDPRLSPPGAMVLWLVATLGTSGSAPGPRSLGNYGRAWKASSPSRLSSAGRRPDVIPPRVSSTCSSCSRPFGGASSSSLAASAVRRPTLPPTVYVRAEMPTRRTRPFDRSDWALTIFGFARSARTHWARAHPDRTFPSTTGLRRCRCLPPHPRYPVLHTRWGRAPRAPAAAPAPAKETPRGS